MANEVHPSRAAHVASWLCRLLEAWHPDGLMPREVELAAEQSGIDWGFWYATPPVLDVAQLELRQAYPGFSTLHWVLKPGANDRERHAPAGATGTSRPPREMTFAGIVDRLARNLPREWEVAINVARECSSVTLIGPEGDEHDVPIEGGNVAGAVLGALGRAKEGVGG